jgi:uncharacterized membrane protein
MLNIDPQNLLHKAKTSPIYVIFSLVGILVLLSAVFSFNFSSLFQGKNQQLEVALIANFEKQNAHEADLLEKGFLDGLKSNLISEVSIIIFVSSSSSSVALSELTGRIIFCDSLFSKSIFNILEANFDPKNKSL